CACTSTCFYQYAADLHDQHSFPTRRSSDLVGVTWPGSGPGGVAAFSPRAYYLRSAAPGARLAPGQLGHLPVYAQPHVPGHALPVVWLGAVPGSASGLARAAGICLADEPLADRCRGACPAAAVRRGFSALPGPRAALAVTPSSRNAHVAVSIGYRSGYDEQPGHPVQRPGVAGGQCAAG